MSGGIKICFCKVSDALEEQVQKESCGSHIKLISFSVFQSLSIFALLIQREKRGANKGKEPSALANGTCSNDRANLRNSPR